MSPSAKSTEQLNLVLPREAPRTVPQFSQAARLRVEKLSHRYGEQTVLKAVSFRVDEGEVVGILGPNGAGKTTLFQILTGLLPHQAGEFFYDGTPFNPMEPVARKHLGVVFQIPSLDQKLSAMENLLLSAALYRIGRKEARERASQLLRFMELEDRSHDSVQKFSGGMKRRLEIIRALIHGPRFLVLDEPTTGFDEAGFQKIWQRLLELKTKTNLTMLLTTHRADEADKCDRLLVLHQGVIVADDTPENLKHSLGGDLLELEVIAIENISKIIDGLKKTFELEATIKDKNKIRFIARKKDGHELIPKIVEKFDKNTFLSINLHRPSIADVFMHLTGNALYGEEGHSDDA